MKFTEETILKYLDGLLSKEEETNLLAAIQHDEELEELFARHSQIHSALKNQIQESPSSSFAERVMASIEHLELAKTRFFNKSRLFVIALVSLILLSTVYYLGMKFYPTLGSALASELSLRQFRIDLNPARNFLDSNTLFKIVFYVNGVISLLLLDRAVLKPYFNRRKERYSM